MGNTEDGFGKKRDHNQYGEIEKDRKDKIIKEEKPLPTEKGTQDAKQ